MARIRIADIRRIKEPMVDEIGSQYGAGWWWPMTPIRAMFTPIHWPAATPGHLAELRAARIARASGIEREPRKAG